MNQSNRHPIDRLADVRAGIKELQTEETVLRDLLLAPDADLVGDQFYGRIVVSNRTVLDRFALEKRFGKDAVKQCLKNTVVKSVTLVRRGDEEGV